MNPRPTERRDNDTSAKISIHPIDNFCGSQHTRRAWQAVLIINDQETPCPHHMGHQTTATAESAVVTCTNSPHVT